VSRRRAVASARAYANCARAAASTSNLPSGCGSSAAPTSYFGTDPAAGEGVQRVIAGRFLALYVFQLTVADLDPGMFGRHRWTAWPLDDSGRSIGRKAAIVLARPSGEPYWVGSSGSCITPKPKLRTAVRSQSNGRSSPQFAQGRDHNPVSRLAALATRRCTHRQQEDSPL
jgi:hypothetical protein